MGVRGLRVRLNTEIVVRTVVYSMLYVFVPNFVKHLLVWAQHLANTYVLMIIFSH